MPSSGSVNITATSLSQLISIPDQTKEISTLNSWEMSGVEFELVISEQVTYFSEASIEIKIHDSESYHFIDTVNFFIGNEVSIFEENFDFDTNTAYHIDAVKFAHYLRKNCCDRVEHYQDTIVSVEKDDEGYVTKLIVTILE